MTSRTEQDKINRKEANQRYYKLEENKQQKRDYMKDYRKNKKWGGKRTEKTIYPHHEKWAKESGYRDRDNDLLHAKNSERFVSDAQRKRSRTDI